jgi:hypothetical protein
MTQYTPTYQGFRPPQNPASPFVSTPPATDIITRNNVIGYRTTTNSNKSLTHDQMDNNLLKMYEQAQGGQSWPLYKGLFLKNKGLDTEGGLFVDNPYNNGATERFQSASGYINYRLDPATDSDFGVILAQGDFLSHKGDVYLKNGGIKYTNNLKFKSDTDSAMTVTGTDVYFGKGSTGNPNQSQVRIGKLGSAGNLNANRVEIGSLNNILNQTTILQIGAAGPTIAENKSGFIKAKQTVLNPPQWDMSFHTYNGSSHVEAISIASDGSVSIPNISNLVAKGPVILGLPDGVSPPVVATGDTLVMGNLEVSGTFTGGSGAGVDDISLTNAASSGLNFTFTSATFPTGPISGNVTLTCDVASDNKIPLADDVITWNNIADGTSAVGSATALATSRLLWGQSFDGTAAVSGSLSGVTSVGAATNPLDLTSDVAVKFISGTGAYRFNSIDNPNQSTHYANLNFNLLRADYVYEFPNKAGTVALTSDITALGLDVVNDWTAIQNFTADVDGWGLSGNLNGNAATASNAAELNGQTATSGNTVSKIVKRNASGNFSAGTITADLTGTASNATNADDADALNGVTATSANTASKIVVRDTNGDFSARKITLSGTGAAFVGNLTGNATTATQTQQFAASSTGHTPGSGNPYWLVNNWDGSYWRITSVRYNESGENPNVSVQHATGADAATLATTAVQSNVMRQSGTHETRYAYIHPSAGGTAAARNLLYSNVGMYVKGGIEATGDITAYFSSDERLKDNITPIPNALERVASLSGNTFDWNDKTDKVGSETGVIAQEVQALGLPDVVTERDDGYLAVRYEKLIPLLIEAIKELKAEVEELKA